MAEPCGYDHSGLSMVFPAFPTCQKSLSTCTILFMIGPLVTPVCVGGIQTPSHWSLVPLRAASFNSV